MIRGMTSWDKIVVSVGNQTCSADETVINNARMEDYPNTKDSLNCIMKDMERPDLANLSFRVLSIAMNDLDCPSFLCAPTSERRVANGFGNGQVRRPRFRGELAASPNSSWYIRSLRRSPHSPNKPDTTFETQVFFS